MSADESMQSTRDAESATRGIRIEAAVLLLVAAGVLAAAWLLQPSPHGYGTHEQLLVIPCAFRWITALPCPACGLTTSFALMARGEVLTALHAHVLGPALYAGTWLLAASAAVALVRGTSPLPRRLRGAGGARWMLIAFGVGWAANLTLHLLGI